MEKEKVLSTIEEIKVISDPFRLKIIFLFDQDHNPLTVKQMAVKLEEVPSKVHYHVKELERIGVLEIVETREKAGVMEKYYFLTAESFRVERSINSSISDDERTKAAIGFFKAMQDDFIRNNKKKIDGESGTLIYGTHYLTAEEKDELTQYLLNFFQNKKPREGAKPYMFGYTLFRKYDGKGADTDGE